MRRPNKKNTKWRLADLYYSTRGKKLEFLGLRFPLNITRISGNLFDCYEINYVHCLFQSIAGPTDSIEPNQQQQQQQTVSKTGYFCSCQSYKI